MTLSVIVEILQMQQLLHDNKHIFATCVLKLKIS